MRVGRNRALQEFRLADEMPFCKEEGDIEEITNALDHLMVRRVDQSMLQAKRRRIQSKRVIEKKEIDDVVVKSLLRLCNAVQDCFAFEHQAAVVRNKAVTRKITRTARETKSKQILRKRILEETQTRTMLRQQKIEHDIEEKIKEATAIAIANRKEEVRSNKREKDRRLLDVAEQEFNRIAQFEEEETEKKNRTKRIAKRAQVSQKRQQHRDDVSKSLATLRMGMDKLDSAADAMLSRRFQIRT